MRLPARTSTVLFGVERADAPRVIEVMGPSGPLAACDVPAIENDLRMQEVHACEVNVTVPDDEGLTIVIRELTGGTLRLFEPAVTVLGS